MSFCIKVHTAGVSHCWEWPIYQWDKFNVGNISMGHKSFPSVKKSLQYFETHTDIYI